MPMLKLNPTSVTATAHPHSLPPHSLPPRSLPPPPHPPCSLPTAPPRTAGRRPDNAGDFLKNGANSIGLVAPLFLDAVAAGNWDVINASAVKVMGNVKAALA